MFNWNIIKGYVSTIGIKATKVGITSYFKAGAKAIPYVGNTIGAIDDIYQDIKIGNLQNTAADLKNSQSVLEGHMETVQASLKEGKSLHSELATELEKTQKELQNNQNLTKEQFKELKIQQKALDSALAINESGLKKLKLEQEAVNQNLKFLEEKQERMKEAISILEDKSLSQEKRLEGLDRIVQAEKERVNKLEQQFSQLSEKVEKIQERIELHQEKLEDLEEKYNDLQEKLAEHDKEINNLKKSLQEKDFQQKSTADKLESLLQYQRLQAEKAKLEQELNDYLEIPVELPIEKTQDKYNPNKLFNLDVNHSYTKEEIFSLGKGYNLQADVYDYYHNKFGSEAMKGWIRLENGEFNDDPFNNEKEATKINKLLELIGLGDENIPQELILKKQELVNLAKGKVESINELAQLLNLEPTALKQKLIAPSSQKIGTLASTHIPWFLIILSAVVSTFVVRKVYNDRKEKQNVYYHNNNPYFFPHHDLLEAEKEKQNEVITISLPIIAQNLTESNEPDDILEEFFQDHSILSTATSFGCQAADVDWKKTERELEDNLDSETHYSKEVKNSVFLFNKKLRKKELHSSRNNGKKRLLVLIKKTIESFLVLAKFLQKEL